MSGRAVDSRSPENFHACKGIVGSNPTSSAKKGNIMKELNMRYGLAALMIVCGLAISLTSVSKITAAEEGPTAAELKEALLDAVFDLDGKKYILTNVTVMKTGPNMFTTSVTTTSKYQVGVNDPK